MPEEEMPDFRCQKMDFVGKLDPMQGRIATRPYIGSSFYYHALYVTSHILSLPSHVFRLTSFVSRLSSHD
jgi:hypothetical protein